MIQLLVLAQSLNNVAFVFMPAAASTAAEYVLRRANNCGATTRVWYGFVCRGFVYAEVGRHCIGNLTMASNIERIHSCMSFDRGIRWIVNINWLDIDFILITEIEFMHMKRTSSSVIRNGCLCLQKASYTVVSLSVKRKFVVQCALYLWIGGTLGYLALQCNALVLKLYYSRRRRWLNELLASRG